MTAQEMLDELRGITHEESEAEEAKTKSIQEQQQELLELIKTGAVPESKLEFASSIASTRRPS